MIKLIIITNEEIYSLFYDRTLHLSPSQGIESGKSDKLCRFYCNVIMRIIDHSFHIISKQQIYISNESLNRNDNNNCKTVSNGNC